MAATKLATNHGSLLAAICASGLPAPVPEHRFHPIRRWRFDWAWPERKIALEYEGGTWNRGRHVRAGGYSADCEKYSEAAILGWVVIRVTSEMVSSGLAMTLLHRAFDAQNKDESRRPTPQAQA